MFLSSKFQHRPSGAATYAGPSFLKVGPDSQREASLLRLASEFSVPVLADGKDWMALELIEQPRSVSYFKLVYHIKKLTLMHNSGLVNPSWRLCSFEDYRAYCLRPISERVPEYLYKIIKGASGLTQKPVFVHGDATLSNSLLVGKTVSFIDLSVRPTTGDPMQDWSKLLFSVSGFDAGDPEFLRILMHSTPYKECFDEEGHIVSDSLAFHLAANVARVLRKEPLPEQLMSNISSLLRNYQ